MTPTYIIEENNKKQKMNDGSSSSSSADDSTIAINVSWQEAFVPALIQQQSATDVRLNNLETEMKNMREERAEERHRVVIGDLCRKFDQLARFYADLHLHPDHQATTFEMINGYYHRRTVLSTQGRSSYGSFLRYVTADMKKAYKRGKDQRNRIGHMNDAEMRIYRAPQVLAIVDEVFDGEEFLNARMPPDKRREHMQKQRKGARQLVEVLEDFLRPNNRDIFIPTPTTLTFPPVRTYA